MDATGGATGRPWIRRDPSHVRSGSTIRTTSRPVAPRWICRIIVTHGWEGARANQPEERREPIASER
jgi:hypothetical protein